MTPLDDETVEKAANDLRGWQELRFAYGRTLTKMARATLLASGLPAQLDEWKARAEKAEARLAAAVCGRLMIGSGDDTYDPECELPPGHDPPCRSTAATDQRRLPESTVGLADTNDEGLSL